MSTENPSTAREWTRTVFSAAQRRIIKALAEAFFDDGATPGLDARLEWTLTELEKLVAASGWVSQLALRVALRVLQLSPVLWGFGFHTVTGLPVADRVRYLDAIEKSAVPGAGVPVFAWKSVLCTHYFEHPDALRETGYDGTCLTGEGSFLDGTRKSRRALNVLAEGGAEVAS